MFQPLFRNLFKTSAIFWTEANGGEWIKLKEAIFMEEDMKGSKPNAARDAARSFLVHAGYKMVHIPGTVNVRNPDVRISAFSIVVRLLNCPDFR